MDINTLKNFNTVVAGLSAFARTNPYTFTKEDQALVSKITQNMHGEWSMSTDFLVHRKTGSLHGIIVNFINKETIVEIYLYNDKAKPRNKYLNLMDKLNNISNYNGVEFEEEMGSTAFTKVTWHLPVSPHKHIAFIYTDNSFILLKSNNKSAHELGEKIYDKLG